MTKNYAETFETREAYIAWRAQWKIEYKALSQRIREMKQRVKETRGDEQSIAQSRLHIERKKANKAMLTLMHTKAKIKAEREALQTAA